MDVYGGVNGVSGLEERVTLAKRTLQSQQSPKSTLPQRVELTNRVKSSQMKPRMAYKSEETQNILKASSVGCLAL